jgi:hypothetical protein
VAEIAQNLLPNEEVRFESHKHWMAPARDSLWAALMIIGAILLGWVSPNQEGGLFGAVGRILDLIRVGLFVFGVGWIIYNVVVWRTAQFAVTNMRVLRYEGLVQRRTSETLLTKVTDTRLSVPLVGKALGYGDVKIMTGSGEAGADNFKTITRPVEFRNAAMVEMTRDRTVPPGAAGGPSAGAAAATAAVAAAPGAAPAPAGTAELADTLARLADLRDKGAITPAEYEAKKTEILSRM